MTSSIKLAKNKKTNETTASVEFVDHSLVVTGPSQEDVLYKLSVKLVKLVEMKNQEIKTLKNN